jgi:hypothetical protein
VGRGFREELVRYILYAARTAASTLAFTAATASGDDKNLFDGVISH